MDPITLRIQTDLLSEIESEADELGYSSRAEYIRHLLQHRQHAKEVLSTDEPTTVVDPKTVQSNSEQITKVTAEVEELGERLDEIEAMIEASTPTTQQSSATTPDTDSQQETNTTTDSDSSNTTAETTLSELEAWLAAEGPRNEVAHEIIHKAATILIDNGPLPAGELKQALYDEFPDAYKSKTTLWGSTIERVYEDAPGFSKPEYGKYDFG